MARVDERRTTMRWSGQQLAATADGSLPGLGLAQVAPIPGHLRTVRPPEFAGITFHEVVAKSALNRVPEASPMPFRWTVNPYRGCSHACVYCFARGSHRYLDLDAGRDFDSQIIVKVNVAEVLRRDLAKPSWEPEHVALGTNTDPYQRAEGRYRLMPGIIRALTDGRTPFSMLTKGTLLRRDLPLLAEANERVRVHLSMSIAIGDPTLQQLIEPGTPSTAARLATVAAAREAGLDCDVFVMPILPFLTDSTSQLRGLFGQIRDTGAQSVVYGALHLREHVKPWFFAWLEREYPELVPRYRALYPGRTSQADRAYRAELADRVRPLLREYRLDRTSDRSRGLAHPDHAAPSPQATPPLF